jgi:hypothetical protein
MSCMADTMSVDAIAGIWTGCRTYEAAVAAMRGIFTDTVATSMCLRCGDDLGKEVARICVECANPVPAGRGELVEVRADIARTAAVVQTYICLLGPYGNWRSDSEAWKQVHRLEGLLARERALISQIDRGDQGNPEGDSRG